MPVIYLILRVRILQFLHQDRHYQIEHHELGQEDKATEIERRDPRARAAVLLALVAVVASRATVFGAVQLEAACNRRVGAVNDHALGRLPQTILHDAIPVIAGSEPEQDQKRLAEIFKIGELGETIARVGVGTSNP